MYLKYIYQTPVGDPDVRHIGSGGVITSHTLPQMVWSQPTVLGVTREATLLHRVPGQLTHVTAGQFPHLSCNAVLLHQRLLGEVELERIIRGQRNIETSH